MEASQVDSKSVLSLQVEELHALLRGYRSQDLSGYKLTTIHKGMARRQQSCRCPSLESYLELLRKSPSEGERLVREVLIGVTSFFRDAEAFESLRLHLCELLQVKPAGEPLRIWVPGCSTGQEAVSLAILVRECTEAVHRARDIQIVATDRNPQAIDRARAARYPASALAGISAARRKRFFQSAASGYRVKDEIREMLVFARHDLIGDPPLARLDMVSCRNLLIYLKPELQERLLSSFYHALQPGSLLFLGNSEFLGQAAGLFDARDPGWRIFRAKAPSALPFLAPPPGSLGRANPGIPSAKQLRHPMQSDKDRL